MCPKAAVQWAALHMGKPGQLMGGKLSHSKCIFASILLENIGQFVEKKD